MSNSVLCLQLYDKNRSKFIYINQFSNQFNNPNKFLSYIKTLKLLILQLHLKTNKTTIRDIYYKDVELYNKNQLNCKAILVQMVETSLNWSLTNDLLIFPSQKGLVYGNGIIINQNIELSYKLDPILIPIAYNDIDFMNKYDNQNSIVVIIVIEKEAIFKSFCNYMKLNEKYQDYYENMGIKLIVITGKGFPDNLTKTFYNYLSNSCLKCTCLKLAFVDSDIYGINIMKQYDNNPNSLYHAGVYLLDYDQGWLNISIRDFKLIQNFLIKNPYSDCHRELTRGMLMFKKCEMNLLNNDVINGYILNKIDYYYINKIKMDRK
ncbi:Spo11/DNA topoisomerase VI subunit A [Scheffersomyces coipomensis]|uniref:Spo11/DNA topoisomerase VI subunit A n=1 Tax=Scheffersomyces coipomensis TaxID=1788519 RepID=UPI00315DA45B